MKKAPYIEIIFSFLKPTREPRWLHRKRGRKCKCWCSKSITFIRCVKNSVIESSSNNFIFCCIYFLVTFKDDLEGIDLTIPDDEKRPGIISLSISASLRTIYFAQSISLLLDPVQIAPGRSKSGIQGSLIIPRLLVPLWSKQYVFSILCTRFSCVSQVNKEHWYTLLIAFEAMYTLLSVTCLKRPQQHGTDLHLLFRFQAASEMPQFECQSKQSNVVHLAASLDESEPPPPCSPEAKEAHKDERDGLKIAITEPSNRSSVSGISDRLRFKKSKRSQHSSFYSGKVNCCRGWW